MLYFKKNNRWEHAQIVNKYKTPRSYILRGENNRIVRRNTAHLRKSFNTPMFRDYGNSFNSRENSRQSGLFINNPIPNTVSNNRSEGTNNENNVNDSNVNNHQEIIQNRMPMPVITRYGRVSNKPIRFINQ